MIADSAATSSHSYTRSPGGSPTSHWQSVRRDAAIWAGADYVDCSRRAVCGMRDWGLRVEGHDLQGRRSLLPAIVGLFRGRVSRFRLRLLADLAQPHSRTHGTDTRPGPSTLRTEQNQGDRVQMPVESGEDKHCPCWGPQRRQEVDPKDKREEDQSSAGSRAARLGLQLDVRHDLRRKHPMTRPRLGAGSRRSVQLNRMVSTTSLTRGPGDLSVVCLWSAASISRYSGPIGGARNAQGKARAAFWR